VVLLEPPGTGKPTFAIALGIAACHTGQRVLFATATDWVAHLQDAHQRDRLPAELTKLRRYGLIIIDEVGYLPFEQDAANLFSSRYEHASLILTSNLPFARWGDVFGDQTVSAANDRPHPPPRRRPHPQRQQLPVDDTLLSVRLSDQTN
jgi:DNA replication protein DnaC